MQMMLSLTETEKDWGEYRDLLKAELARAFGIPPILTLADLCKCCRYQEPAESGYCYMFRDAPAPTECRQFRPPATIWGKR